MACRALVGDVELEAGGAHLVGAEPAGALFGHDEAALEVALVVDDDLAVGQRHEVARRLAPGDAQPERTMGLPVVSGEAGAVQEHPGAGRGPGGADDHPRVVHLVRRLRLLRLHDVLDRRRHDRGVVVVVTVGRTGATVGAGALRGATVVSVTGGDTVVAVTRAGTLLAGTFFGCRDTPASSRPSPLSPQPVATTMAATPIPILHHRRFPPIVPLPSSPLTPRGRGRRGDRCVTVLQLVLAPPISVRSGG